MLPLWFVTPTISYVGVKFCSSLPHFSYLSISGDRWWHCPGGSTTPGVQGSHRRWVDFGFCKEVWNSWCFARDSSKINPSPKNDNDLHWEWCHWEFARMGPPSHCFAFDADAPFHLRRYKFLLDVWSTSQFGSAGKCWRTETEIVCVHLVSQ